MRYADMSLNLHRRPRPRWPLGPMLLATLLSTAACATAATRNPPKPSDAEPSSRDRSKAVSPYAITRFTVDAGGGRSEDGQWVVSGTLGQAEPNPAGPSGANGMAVSGGFWRGESATNPDSIFRNGFEN